MIAQPPPHTSQGLRTALSWLVCACGLITVLASLYIGIRAYTPVLFADEWQVPMDYMIAGGHYGLAKLWAQHNEHRIPFQKLIQLVDMFWWKTDHRPLLVLGWLVQGAQWSAAAFFLKRTSRLTGAEFLTALGVLAFFLFNPNQMQIFEWAFSPSFLGAFFCASVSLGALALYSISKARFWLILAVACAFLSECNLANGVLVWVMLPVCAMLLRLRWKVVAALTGCGAVGVGVYLIGYRSPSNATSPLEAIRHPADVFAFCQAYFAESWHFIAPRAGNAAAAAAIAAILTIAIHHLLRRRPEREPAEAWLLSLACMMLLTSFITALGRQISGVAQAREGRYQVAAMLFWCVTMLLLILQTKYAGGFRTYALVALQLLFLAAAASEARAYPQLLRQYTGDGYIRSLAGVSFEAGIFDEAADRFIYPYPPAVPPTYNYLRLHNWIDPPFPTYNAVGKSLNQVFTIPAGEVCAGYVDEVHVLGAAPSKQLEAEGWAYSSTRKTTFGTLLAVSDSSRILGIGLSGGERPDIPKVLNFITAPNTGWRVYAVAPPEAKQLSVYAILPGTNQVCQIGSAKPIP